MADPEVAIRTAAASSAGSPDECVTTGSCVSLPAPSAHTCTALVPPAPWDRAVATPAATAAGCCHRGGSGGDSGLRRGRRAGRCGMGRGGIAQRELLPGIHWLRIARPRRRLELDLHHAAHGRRIQSRHTGGRAHARLGRRAIRVHHELDDHRVAFIRNAQIRAAALRVVAQRRFRGEEILAGRHGLHGGARCEHQHQGARAQAPQPHRALQALAIETHGFLRSDDRRDYTCAWRSARCRAAR